MIDLHCHLLPGIDDGAEDMVTALALARMAADSGTTHMVCTPHMHPGRFENTAAGIAESLAGFRQALQDAQIPLQVGWAAEVRFDMEIMIKLPAGEIPFIGRWQDKDVMLLEFPHGEIPFGAERLTQWLLQRNVLPMIAHPERNKGVMRAPAQLKSFIQQGCLLQVTAGAIVGRFGQRAQELAEELLQEGVVTVIASDAHNLQHRPPLLNEGRERAAQLLGEAAAEALVLTRPAAMAAAHFVV